MNAQGDDADSERLEFGLTVYGNKPAQIPGIVRHAEELGFDRAWVGDHVVLPIGYESTAPYPYHHETPIVAPEAEHHFDVWVMVSQLLAVTRHMRIGTAVLVAPLRHPLLQARAALTAHELSGGRFDLGLGSGWLAEEFAALDVDFAARGRRLEEVCDVLAAAFAGGPFEYSGRFYGIPRVQLSPSPVGIPLIFGGSGPRAIERAARRGDGWTNPTDCDLADCILIRETIAAVRADCGLAERPFDFHIKLVRPPTTAEIEPYVEAGFRSFVLAWNKIHPPERGADVSDKLRSLDALASELGITR